ncbi:NfeD family protein [Haloimpatiens sp. FM7315]|uniref:NfeD family protein n=1 Tax=Haloimpatiens sp. FM7315 TaxID=3298609 RepID=UPI0035A29167
MSWFNIILWMVIGIVALIVDIGTSAFLFVWFTVGAVGALLAMCFGAPFYLQGIVFVILSLLSMGTGYPIVKRSLKSSVKRTKTMEENYIGREMVSKEDILNRATIKFDGIYWTVDNEGEEIKKGDKIKIVGISGNKLVVKKID